MEKFTYNSKTVEVPSCLDEVSSEQYRQFLILAVLIAVRSAPDSSA